MSIARNSILSLMPQLVSVLVGIVSSIITARYLGTAGRGALAVVNVTVTLLALISNLGLSYSLTYFVAKQRLTEQEAMGVAVAASFVVSLPFALAGLLVVAALKSSVLAGVDSASLVAGILALPAVLFINLWSTIRLALKEFGKVARFQAAVAIVGIVVVSSVLVGFGLGLRALVIANTLTTYGYIVYLAMADLRKHGVSFKWPRGIVRDIGVYGLKVYVGSLVNYSYLRLDAYILNTFSGTAAVGLYSTAVTLNEKLWILDNSVSQAVLPDVVSRDEEDSARLTAFTARTNLLVGAGAALVLGLVTPWLVPMMYGAEFRGAVLPLVLLLPGTVAYAGSRPFAHYVSGQRGRPELTSGLAAVVALLGVVVYLILIPLAGAAGAAIASSIVYSVNFYALFLMFSRMSSQHGIRTLALTRDDLAVYASVLTRLTRRLAHRD